MLNVARLLCAGHVGQVILSATTQEFPSGVEPSVLDQRMLARRLTVRGTSANPGTLRPARNGDQR